MKMCDIVKLKTSSKELGIILWKHPTKEIARVYWVKDGTSLERCGRLEIVSDYNVSHALEECSHKL